MLSNIVNKAIELIKTANETDETVISYFLLRHLMLKLNTLNILAYARTLISQMLKYVLGSSNGTVINHAVLRMYQRFMVHKKCLEKIMGSRQICIYYKTSN
jgi:hypothetical protein